MALVDAPAVMGEHRGVRGYLYLTDPEGNEIPGSRRSLANMERGTGGFAELENELKRLAGEGCEVRWSEE